MKIGLISDTHTTRPVLPQTVLDAFRGVDMILHARDLVALGVLDALAGIAPVTAVYGNIDAPATRVSLPVRTVVEAGGKRIGLIHGDGVPQPNRVLAPPLDFDSLHAYLLTEFSTNPPDCIVYGHTHAAHVEIYRGVLMINPGSAMRGSDGCNSVGRLAIVAGQISAEIVRLS